MNVTTYQHHSGAVETIGPDGHTIKSINESKAHCAKKLAEWHEFHGTTPERVAMQAPSTVAGALYELLIEPETVELFLPQDWDGMAIVAHWIRKGPETWTVKNSARGYRRQATIIQETNEGRKRRTVHMPQLANYDNEAKLLLGSIGISI